MRELLSKTKIYSLTKAPNAQAPYLCMARHAEIIEHFNAQGNAFHVLNMEGDADFYFLLPAEMDFDSFLQNSEELTLSFNKQGAVTLKLIYEAGLQRLFHFDLQDPLDYQSLQALIEKKTLVVYYIQYLEYHYVCCALKSITIPTAFYCDLERLVSGKRPLTFPRFQQDLWPAKALTAEVLLGKGWGFFIDYPAVIARESGTQEAEEMVSRYILHGLARLQRSRSPVIRRGSLYLWVGRKLRLNRQGVPTEYYCVYLSGQQLSGVFSKDQAALLISEILGELPEYEEALWMSPLAEESIPFAALEAGKLYRIELSVDFYQSCSDLFSENFYPGEDHSSYYDKVLRAGIDQGRSKIYQFMKKRKRAIKRRT